MELELAREEIKQVSDLYKVFNTTNHLEILKRYVSILEMFLDYHNHIHQIKNLPKKIYDDLREAKIFYENRGPIYQVDKSILLINHNMLKIRSLNIHEEVKIDFDEDDDL